MSHLDYFASDYQEARGKFRTAARASDAVLRNFDHPNRGPGGEQLACDTAWYGDKKAERVVVTISATHGVEGFCGSGVQVGWFEAGLAQELPAGLGVIAVNPGIIDTRMLRVCWGEAAGQYPSAREWAGRAVPFLAGLSSSQSGQSVDV